MSWKTDKFQALRDRAEGPKPGKAKRRAEQAAVDAVVTALRPEPEPRPVIWSGAVWSGAVWSAATLAKFRDPGKAIKPLKFNLTGKSAHAVIIDDICGVPSATYANASASATAVEINARVKAAEAAMRAMVDEARIAAEVADELRDEPRNQLYPSRNAYAVPILQPSSVVCISGA